LFSPKLITFDGVSAHPIVEALVGGDAENVASAFVDQWKKKLETLPKEEAIALASCFLELPLLAPSPVDFSMEKYLVAVASWCGVDPFADKMDDRAADLLSPILAFLGSTKLLLEADVCADGKTLKEWIGGLLMFHLRREQGGAEKRSYAAELLSAFPALALEKASEVLSIVFEVSFNSQYP
jgi:hypothetical protein